MHTASGHDRIMDEFEHNDFSLQLHDEAPKMSIQLLQCLKTVMLLFGAFDVLKHLMLWCSVIAAGKAAGTSNHSQYFYCTVLEDNKKCSERNTFRQ